MAQATSSSGIGQSVRSEIPMLSIIVIIDHYYVAWAPTLNLNSTVRTDRVLTRLRTTTSTRISPLSKKAPLSKKHSRSRRPTRFFDRLWR
jgi:hypothetical protein